MSSTSSPGTALITGASSGIGSCYANRLAKQGYKLLLVARDLKRLQGVAAGLTAAFDASVEVMQADLTLPDDLARVEHRLASDREISLLVNNAGMTVEGSFAACDIEKVTAMLALNIAAPTRLARAAAGMMVQRGTGTIINLGSVTSLLPEYFGGAYSGSKAYILNLSIAMHRELSEQGIRVQAVLPGATRTEIWERAGLDLDAFPPDMVMDVDTLVDAALSGLRQGETVTIPSLPAIEDWERYNTARLALRPFLSLNAAAPRYRSGNGSE